MGWYGGQNCGCCGGCPHSSCSNSKSISLPAATPLPGSGADATCCDDTLGSYGLEFSSSDSSECCWGHSGTNPASCIHHPDVTITLCIDFTNETVYLEITYSGKPFTSSVTISIGPLGTYDWSNTTEIQDWFDDGDCDATLNLDVDSDVRIGGGSLPGISCEWVSGSTFTVTS